MIMNTRILTDNKKTIHTDGKLIYADTTYKVRGCAFNVFNELGNGHKEAVYQKALEKELIQQNIPYKKESSINVNYKGESIGNYRPDFIIDDKIIIELKAVEFLPVSFEKQLVHYLKSTEFKLGILINFGANKLYIKRLIWTGSA